MSVTLHIDGHKMSRHFGLWLPALLLLVLRRARPDRTISTPRAVLAEAAHAGPGKRATRGRSARLVVTSCGESSSASTMKPRYKNERRTADRAHSLKKDDARGLPRCRRARDRSAPAHSPRRPRAGPRRLGSGRGGGRRCRRPRPLRPPARSTRRACGCGGWCGRCRPRPAHLHGERDLADEVARCVPTMPPPRTRWSRPRRRSAW